MTSNWSSFIIFERTPIRDPEAEQQNTNQILHAYIYERDKEFRVVSCEGLQYVRKQK